LASKSLSIPPLWWRDEGGVGRVHLVLFDSFSLNLLAVGGNMREDTALNAV
jgi:hypothetical protein